MQKEKRIIVDSPYDPRKILRHRKTAERILRDMIPYPVNIEVDLTSGACNNNCIFCCFGSNRKNTPVFLQPKPLIKTLENAAKNGTKSVELVGGSDPTMHKDIADIAKKIVALDLNIGLITNGLLLDRIFPAAKDFTFIRISLDAGTEETYAHVHGIPAFNQVLTNIKTLKNFIPSEKIGLAYLVIPQNSKEEEIRAFTEKAIQLGVGYIVFRPAILPKSIEMERLRNNLHQILSLINSLADEFAGDIRIYHSAQNRWTRTIQNTRGTTGKCRACLFKGVICADGSVPFCNLARNDKSRSLGNIYRKSFSEIWGSSRHNKFLEDIDIKDCPVPCAIDDYRDILYEYQENILNNTLPPLTFSKHSHENFV